MKKSDITVLIVDPAPFIRGIIKNQLRTIGYDCIIEAQDGSTALDTIKKEQIDLIISSWNASGISGLELLRIIRSNPLYKDIPFVLITSVADQSKIHKAILLKVNQLILKPFSQETFEHKINIVMQPALSNVAGEPHENISLANNQSLHPSIPDQHVAQ